MRRGELFCRISAVALEFTLLGCSGRIPEKEFVAYYEKHCKTEASRGGVVFSALPASSDYERLKWAYEPDSGFRVLLWTSARTGASHGDVFLLSGGDTLRPVAERKAPVFETGNTDAYIFAFPHRVIGAELNAFDFGQGSGHLRFHLKDCSRIRVEENR